MSTFWLPDVPPASAGALDDEFTAIAAGVPSGWTEVDFDTRLTVTGVQEPGLVMQQSTVNAQHVAGIYQSLPSGDFTVWMKIGLYGRSIGSILAGLALWQDATNSAGDIAMFAGFYGAGNSGVVMRKHTAYNAAPTTIFTRNMAPRVVPTTFYLRIRLATATYAFDYSTDGVEFQQCGTTTLTYTPAHVGIAINNVAVANDMVIRAPFFRYVASDVGATGRANGRRVSFGGGARLRMLMGVGL